MERTENTGGGAAVRRATTLEEVGRLLLEPGTVIEMDRATAEACGACQDDCIDPAEALEAAGDPFDFGGGGGDATA